MKTGSNGVEQLVYSSKGLKLAAFIARTTPPRIGHHAARMAADWVASRRNSELVKAVRANQAVVAGGAVPPARLDEIVQGVFRSSASSIYELYHSRQDPATLEAMYCVDASFQWVLKRAEFEGRGLLIAGLHMAGFDLGLRWLCRYKFKPLVLTMPNPQQGRQLELEGRRQMQMNVLPYSTSALRQAVRHLQQGGMVLSGIDHPVPSSDLQPCFFGRPAALPTDHTFLGLRANVPVVVVASRLQADGKYHIYASPPIELGRLPDRSAELRISTERVLALAESFIRKAPEQWLIFQRVWPGITPSHST